MKKSESIGELAKALAKFQASVKQPLKDANNPFFKSKYVPLENVVESITESAGALGLSFIQYPVNTDNRVGVITILMHESGEWIETEPIYATPAKQDPQATGSAITYLKRYSLSAVFGITSDEDDDGNSNAQQSNQNNYRQQQPRQQANSNNISDAQIKAMKAKLNNLNKHTGIEMQTIYVDTLKQCNIPEQIATKDLSKAQAIKVITALAEREAEFV